MKHQLKKIAAIVALLLMGSLNFAFVECPAADDPFGTYLPHQSDCSKYYMCSNGRAIEMQCPMGLEWNVALNICDFPESAGCEAGGGSNLLGDEVRYICPRMYDITRVTQSEETLSYKVEGNANYRFIAEVIINGSIYYKYDVKSEQRIQTERVQCPRYWGFCFVKACGQEL